MSLIDPVILELLAFVGLMWLSAFFSRSETSLFSLTQLQLEQRRRDYAAWTLIEGNDKHFARIKVLRTLCERMELALD